MGGICRRSSHQQWGQLISDVDTCGPLYLLCVARLLTLATIPLVPLQNLEKIYVYFVSVHTGTQCIGTQRKVNSLPLWKTMQLSVLVSLL